jgi:hypothetical protein
MLGQAPHAYDENTIHTFTLQPTLSFEVFRTIFICEKEGFIVSVYRIHFTWKEKPRILRARSLDMTHPYFVSIRGLIFPESSSVIIDPSEDELHRDFGEAEHIMIPFQNVALIEELPDRPASDTGKVIPFSAPEDPNDG